MKIRSLLLFYALLIAPLKVGAIVDSTQSDSSKDVLEKAPHQVNYTSIDERAARSLQEIFDTIRTHRTKKKNIRNMTQQVLASSYFAELKEPLNYLQSIDLHATTLSEHSKRCSEPPPESLDPMAKKIKQSAMQLCDARFLSLINSTAAKKLSAEDFRYLFTALPRLLTSQHKPNLNNFFSGLNRETALSKTLTQKTVEVIISENLIPDAGLSIILQSNISAPPFDHYLQSLNIAPQLDNANTMKTFAEQGKQLARRIEEGSLENDEQVQSLVAQGNELIARFQAQKKFLSARSVWHYFTLIGKEWRYRGHPLHAKKFFEYANEAGPSEERSESFYQLIWDDIVASNWAAAQKSIERYNLIEKFPQHDDKLQFWIAYNVKMLGQKHLARHLYAELIHRSPLSYYAIIGLNELADLNDHETKEGFYRKIASTLPSLSTKQKHFSSHFVQHLTRLRLWADLGLNSHSEEELTYLVSLPREKIFENNIFRTQLSDKEKDQLLIEIVATVMSQNGHHLQTFKLVFNALGERVYQLDRKTLNYLFPLNYFTEIQKFSQGLDPLFVLSLIRQESAFNPEAKSHVGATGLMQLMPKTAAQFQTRLKGKMLELPETNIKIGVKYLRQLVQRYDGNMILALAAYNAGKNRVDRWKGSILTSQNPLIMIESIPYKETRLYVQLIYRNLFFYNFLQTNEGAKLPIEQSFRVSLN